MISGYESTLQRHGAGGNHSLHRVLLWAGRRADGRPSPLYILFSHIASAVDLLYCKVDCLHGSGEPPAWSEPRPDRSRSSHMKQGICSDSSHGDVHCPLPPGWQHLGHLFTKKGEMTIDLPATSATRSTHRPAEVVDVGGDAFMPPISLVSAAYRLQLAAKARQAPRRRWACEGCREEKAGLQGCRARWRGQAA